MTEKKTKVITIDNKEYEIDSLTDEQKVMINHITDLDRKIKSTRFNLDQLQIGSQAFYERLKNSLPKEEKAE